MSGSLVDGLCRHLAAAGHGAYSPDDVLPADQTPITVAGMPSSDGPAICLTTYGGGPEPDARNKWEYPRMQVRVRHADPLAALDLDRALFVTLQALGGIALPGGSWFLQDCYALQSEAQPMGADDNGRWEYVRNYQLSTELRSS